MTGGIPLELGNLPILRSLSLSRNQLSSEIPVELGNLLSLNLLGLSDNSLTGEIPSELGRLSNLEVLWLSDNQLSGIVPAEFGDLSGMRQMDLSSNQLSGEIPAELGNLLALKWLELNENLLNGEIPMELGSLPNLVELTLNGNQLSGCIPDALRDVGGDLPDLVLSFCTPGPTLSQSPDGFALVALYNATDGENWKNNAGWLSELPIDEWYGVRVNGDGRVIELALSDNQLSGEIPAELETLSEPRDLYLSDNQWSGCIPYDLGQIELYHIDLPRCERSPAASRSPDRAALFALYNATDGNNWKNNAGWLNALAIDEWYGVEVNEQGRVIELALTDNHLNGEIPAELEALSELRSLYLSDNQLTGCIPYELTYVPVSDLYSTDLAFCEPSQAAVTRSPDRSALIALYNATDGENWENNTDWLSDAPLFL